jgi:hypothetical protein
MLGIALLLAGCGGDTGMRCEYSAGNLDAIKAQVATLKAGGTRENEVIKSLGNRRTAPRRQTAARPTNTNSHRS